MSEADVDQLLKLLNSDEIMPAQLEAAIASASEETKNALVARIAHTFEPAPRGRLLLRLLSIVTDANKPDLITAYIANLRSPSPKARKASLWGLDKLEYASIVDLAVAALRDESDEVIAAACSILLEKAKTETRLMQILKELYEAHKGKPEYYMSTSLLEAHLAGG